MGEAMIAVQSSRNREFLFETGKVDIKCGRSRFRAAGTDSEIGLFEVAAAEAKRAPTCHQLQGPLGSAACHLSRARGSAAMYGRRRRHMRRRTLCAAGSLPL